MSQNSTKGGPLGRQGVESLRGGFRTPALPTKSATDAKLSGVRRTFPRGGVKNFENFVDLFF